MVLFVANLGPFVLKFPSVWHKGGGLLLFGAAKMADGLRCVCVLVVSFLFFLLLFEVIDRFVSGSSVVTVFIERIC